MLRDRTLKKQSGNTIKGITCIASCSSTPSNLHDLYLYVIFFFIWMPCERSFCKVKIKFTFISEERLRLFNNNNLLHLYSAFLDTQSALHSKGAISSSTTNVQHPPGWCDGSHSAPECPPHTSLLVERRQSDAANQCMGMIRRPWWSEASGLVWPGCRGYTPTVENLYYYKFDSRERSNHLRPKYIKTILIH